MQTCSPPSARHARLKEKFYLPGQAPNELLIQAEEQAKAAHDYFTSLLNDHLSRPAENRSHRVHVACRLCRFSAG
jgi:hypothetical protein